MCTNFVWLLAHKVFGTSEVSSHTLGSFSFEIWALWAYTGAQGTAVLSFMIPYGRVSLLARLCCQFLSTWSAILLLNLLLIELILCHIMHVICHLLCTFHCQRDIKRNSIHDAWLHAFVNLMSFLTSSTIPWCSKWSIGYWAAHKFMLLLPSHTISVLQLCYVVKIVWRALSLYI